MEQPLVLHYPRPCGCKGIRRCLTCESDFGADVDYETKTVDEEPSFCSFVFCTHCSVAYFAQMEEYEAKDCGWHQRLGNGTNGNVDSAAAAAAIVVVPAAAVVVVAAVGVVADAARAKIGQRRHVLV